MPGDAPPEESGEGRQYEDVPPPSDEERRSESKRPYLELLRIERAQGLLELRRPVQGLALSGLSAGLDIGFTALFTGVVWSLVHEDLSAGVTRLLVAAVYPLGFIFVILGRSELFTEHTTLAVIPVLTRRAPVRALARLWGNVYAFNILGAVAAAALIAWLGPRAEIIEPAALAAIADPLISPGPLVLTVGAVFAGWLMGLVSWLVAAGRDTTSQLLLIFLTTGGIGLAHLPHCIAGTVEVLVAVFAGAGPTLGDFGHFLLWATVGNAVGGAVFVAGLKQAHVRYHG